MVFHRYGRLINTGMLNFPILSLLVFLPLIGASFIMTIKGGQATIEENSKRAALYTSVCNLVLSLFLFLGFDGANPDFQFVERMEWLPSLGLSYYLGVDGISLFFIMLSAFLTPICILASWNSVKKRVKEYMVMFLILETFMIGTFCSLDAIMFYIFFEGVLIPMYFIIGIWGGERRIYSAYKFFLYTLLGSVLLLLAIIFLYFSTGTGDIPVMMNTLFPREVQIWLWLAVFAGFVIKIPMWPVHTWLPDAHVDAPTAGSVILAGVLLKMGGYGFLRFSIPMFPEASQLFAPMIYTLSVIAIIYTSMIALVQKDMKKLIAYSSVAHMGFVTLGLFSATIQGIEGGIFQMLSHGMISAALFLCVGVLYERMGTRAIAKYGGLVRNMPKFATIFMILTLASVGLPGTSGFVGEFLTLLAIFKVNNAAAFLAATGIILGAAYMLRLYKNISFGKPAGERTASLPDLNKRELAIFIPMVAIVLLLGFNPSIVLDKTSASVESLAYHYQAVISENQDYQVTKTGEREGKAEMEVEGE